MVDPDRVTISGESEPDPDPDMSDPDDMGLHPDLTGEQMQRIMRGGQGEGAPQAEGEGAPQAEGEGAPQAPKKRKYNVNLKAEAWKHFIRGVTKEDGSYTATCKYCGIVYDMGNQKGTGSLRHHYLKSCQKKPTRKNADKKQQLLQFQNATEAGENKVAVWSFDQATCRKYLAIMVIVHEYPFNIVSHYFFRAFSLVLDNASSNDACIRELLGGPMRDALPVDGSVFHQRCGCHILNLVVQDGISVLTDEITKVRETMKYLRHSQARMERFKLASSQVKVPNKKPAWDVPTRWNSTYLMLELALELRPAIERYATLDKHYTLKPKDTEWEAVEALMDCLKIFYTATLKFSAVKYPTLNYFFPEMCEVYVSIKNMESSPYPFIVLMATKMFAKWERYWTSGNTLLAIACVLDPRCKVAVVEYYFKLVYPGHHDFYMSNLNACINAMFMEYLEAYNSSLQSQTESSSRTQSQSQRCQSSGASSSGAVNNIRAGLKSLLAEKKTTEPVKSELEQYISEPLDDTALEAEFDILAWWKLKVPKYPVLSRLARDILAVPASTVASESTFSTSGRTLSVVRNSLNDEHRSSHLCSRLVAC
ncbi:Zinc finger BED domain-containing protein DAYSLEEPER [Rhynchospora pubera]|uniref:Zinc finger BED domain-containing protein DAYSLEEPER n=1 Tax=Rhynchospora pubera TaxID=906938 RepID=A0AAV8FKF0_9POAL|nr:Zinc finger BED domain-containing protein DAYSLEEPER [Rhynchospora pubera]